MAVVDRHSIVLGSSADWARHYGCGNCGEASALAFVYLADVGIRPLDWMEVNDFQHAFVVVGQLNDSDPADYTTWGRTRKKMQSLFRLN